MLLDRDRSEFPDVRDLDHLPLPSDQTDSGANTARRILVSIPSGFQLRQFVHSRVVDLLIELGFTVLFLTPNRDEEGLVSGLPLGRARVIPVDLQFGPLRRRYWAARQHLLLKDEPTDTLRQKRVDFRHRYPWMGPAVYAGNRVLRSMPLLRRRILAWERFVLRVTIFDKILAVENVDLILLGSPGYFEQDAVLLHAAARRRIPVAAAVLSWDNLSSKGIINPHPDRLLVWSGHMRREAIEIQGIPAASIVETGTTVHDAFANAGRFGSRSDNFRRLGLDPKQRLIFYGTNHGASFRDEVEVVKQVAKWVESDSLGEECQLWIRIHPQGVSGVYKIQADDYFRLASKRVIVEFPPVRDNQMPWELPRSDLEHLVGLLRDADVVINSGSLSIDAAILDRPVICIAYDPGGELPYEQSVRRYYDFTHLAHVVRAQAVRLANSADDLRQKIIAYLANPSLDREGRSRIVEQQFGRVDGASAKRLVATVVQMLSQ